MFLCKILYLSALLLILVPLIISLPYQHHDVQRRSSFFDIDCKGELQFYIFITLVAARIMEILILIRN